MGQGYLERLLNTNYRPSLNQPAPAILTGYIGSKVRFFVFIVANQIK